MTASPVHFKFVEHCRGGGHVDVKVFAGVTPGSLGCCGGLVMRVEEWVALRVLLALPEDVGKVVHVEVQV